MTRIVRMKHHSLAGGGVLMIVLTALVHLSEPAAGQIFPEPVPGLLAGQADHLSHSPEPGLLFHISGESGYGADFAAGDFCHRFAEDYSGVRLNQIQVVGTHNSYKNPLIKVTWVETNNS